MQIKPHKKYVLHLIVYLFVENVFGMRLCDRTTTRNVFSNQNQTKGITLCAICMRKNHIVAHMTLKWISY